MELSLTVCTLFTCALVYNLGYTPCSQSRVTPQCQTNLYLSHMSTATPVQSLFAGCVSQIRFTPKNMSPAGKLNPKRSTLLYLILLLLANSSDIEANPGPVSTQPSSLSSDDSTAHLCGACKEPVTWNDKGVMCETCDTWYHTGCQKIGDTTYAQLGLSSIAWVCLKCNGPNYSSVLFDLHGIDSNPFSILDESIQSIGSIDSQDMNRPKHASSPIRPRPQAAQCPRPLRIINHYASSM